MDNNQIYSDSATSSEEKKFIESCLDTVLSGLDLDENALYKLTGINTPEGTEALLEGAARITRTFCPRVFDTCSIANARSGRCSENCKWCAQSGHFNTGCRHYDIIDHDTCMEMARDNAGKGVHRFSLVASGRKTSGKALTAMISMLKEVREKYPIHTCASLGLLNKDELKQLWDAGVHRYHCNLETAPSYFHHLCTTHTIEDKIATIDAAREIGFEICSGGIIGMGETRRQRMELAITLRRVKPHSIPINILSPIPGTPLGKMPLIPEEEVLIAIALFRFAHPKVQLRFAGGRARLSDESMIRAMEVGINGATVGDLLTTIGRTIAEDKVAVAKAGYEWSAIESETEKTK